MSLNLFRLCSGLRVLGYFMIAIVAAIVAASYYSVVVITYGPRLLRGGVRSFTSFCILLVFHFLLVMLVWCYFMVVFQDPGSVPENLRPVAGENFEFGSSNTPPDYGSNDARASPLAPLDEARQRPVEYCDRCQNIKPPRCHHCSVCQRCVLKMDHHCVWVVNCVGACNYKFFLLFLMYTFVETTLDTLVLMPHFIKIFGDVRSRSNSSATLVITFVAFVLNLAFALSLLCFLVMHASLLSSNTTTLEVNEKKRAVRWKYDLGRRKNFEQVFGTKKLYWLLPLFSAEDLENVPALKGLDFPIHSGAEV